MNILNAIRGIESFIDNEVFMILYKTKYSEYIPIVDITPHKDAFYDAGCIAYTYRPHNGSYAYLRINVYKDGDVTVFYNHDGSIRSGITSNFTVNNTEEELFMANTIQDNFDIGVEEIKLFNKVWRMYF